MDWWQAGSVMGTTVLAVASVATLGWRVVRQEFDRRREDTERLRQESREAHEKIGDRITQVRDGLGAEIAQVRDGLGAQIAQLRDGQAGLREGLGEIRGDLKGVRHSLQSLQEDFRAHVIRGNQP